MAKDRKALFNLKVESIAVDDLNEYANNPRINDHAVPAMAEAIKKFGFLVPVLFRTKDMEVVDGHLRLKAAKKLGMTEVSAIRVDHLSDDEVRALRININRVAELAEWDNEKLKLEMVELKDAGLDVAITGFDERAFDNLVAGLDVYNEKPIQAVVDSKLDDEIPEVPTNPKSKVGTIYKLGPHRLLCGDCTDLDLVETMFKGTQADMLWTDPPWNVAYGAPGKPSSEEDRQKRTKSTGWKKDQSSRVIMNDALGEHFPEFCKNFCKSFHKFTKAGAHAYVVMSAQEWPVIHQTLTDAGFHWSSTIIWAKDRLVMSRKDYHTQYEPMWYGWNADASRNYPLKDRSQTDLWNIPRPSRSDEHPMMKPIELIARSIANSSAKGDLIFDPFGGSGSTLIASATTGRRAFTCELDPKFADVIRKRWTRYAKENKLDPGEGALE